MWRFATNRLWYAFSVGCIESQNTYFDGSEHTCEIRLHINVASMKPLPQQPRSTSSNPTHTNKLIRIFNSPSHVIITRLKDMQSDYEVIFTSIQ